MANGSGQMGMGRYLSRKLMPLSVGIGLLLALLAPLTYWILEHRNLQRMANLYAEGMAEKFRHIAQESPALWKYQSYKFIAVIGEFHPTIDVVSLRILDEKGEPVTGNDYSDGPEKHGRELTFTEELGFTLGTVPILFNNQKLGTMEVLVSDVRLLRTTAILSCFSTIVGTLLAVLVYRFPVGVVRVMEGEIGELIANLRRSEEMYRGLSEELELKVEERTRQLSEAQEELVQGEKLALLGLIAAGMGNELRNPLGVMSNAVFFLRNLQPDASETVREYLEIIRQEIDNSQRIISDLLDYCHITTPRTAEVPVAELIGACLDRCSIPENILLRTEAEEPILAVSLDSMQMVRVLRNLVTNAVQAMPDGGTLRISARKARGAGSGERGIQEENLEPRTSNLEPDFVEISVADTGTGIAPEQMARLFQPLFSTKSRGIGLGLALSRKLVEANGGRIEVESEPGEGTTFTVILPVTKGGDVWEGN